MPNFETPLPVKPVTGNSVVSIPLLTALQNPIPVLNPSNGVQISPIPPGGAFDVPFSSLVGGQ